MLIRKIILFIVILTFCCLPFISKERYILLSNAVVNHGKRISLQVLAFADDTTNALTANSSSSAKSAPDNAIKPIRKGFFAEDREEFLTDVAQVSKEKDYHHEINSYKRNKFIQSSIVMGGAFDRYIKYRDEDGKVSIKNGLYTEFRVDVEI